MARNGCRKTCNLCEGENNAGGRDSLATVIADELCQDALPSCDLLTAKSGCGSLVMKAQCAKTCKVCVSFVAKAVDKITNTEDSTTATPIETVSVSKSEEVVVEEKEAEVETTTVVKNETTETENTTEADVSEEDINVIDIIEEEEQASGSDDEVTKTSSQPDSPDDSNITVVTTKQTNTAGEKEEETS